MTSTNTDAAIALIDTMSDEELAPVLAYLDERTDRAIPWGQLLSKADQDVYAFAVRYAISRSTGAPLQVVTALTNVWYKLSQYTKDDICDEIKNSIHRGAVSQKLNAELWASILRLDDA